MQQVDTAGRVDGSSGEVDTRGLEVATPRDTNVADRVGGDIEAQPPSRALQGADTQDASGIANAVLAGQSAGDLNAFPSAVPIVTGEVAGPMNGNDHRDLMGEWPLNADGSVARS